MDERRASEILRRVVALIDPRSAGGRALPPERELARSLGTSRVTLRQALAALERWGVVAARQGSGVRVQGPAEWSLAALPSLLAGAAPGSPEAARLRPLAIEALALRRSFARRAPAELAGRLAVGALRTTRERIAEAWAARASPARFVSLDAAILRGAFEAAGATAATWLWNDLSRVPRALAAGLPERAPVAPDYEARQEALCNALETSDAAQAERLLGAHLARLDRGLLAGFAGEPIEGRGR
jgi:GntR family transcriptional repressor for pyruvate dehydrogenase complex